MPRPTRRITNEVAFQLHEVEDILRDYCKAPATATVKFNITYDEKLAWEEKGKVLGAVITWEQIDDTICAGDY